MERKFYVLAVLVLLYCFVFRVCAQKKYYITSCSDIRIKSNGEYLSVKNCKELSESDSIEFGRRGTITLFSPECETEYSYSCANTTLPVKMLVAVERKTSPISKTVENVRLYLPYGEKQEGILQAVKSEMDNDSIQAIPVEIYRFLKSDQQINGNGISVLISWRLDFNEKLCTVVNNSDSGLYIDVLHVDDKQQCMSVFSPMLDWVSNLFVPAYSERTFWFVGDFPSSDSYLLVGSKEGLPLNGIFKLYRPGVEYKDRRIEIELILRKL